MADNTMTGRAKKHDGTAIDYVSIFNWSDGTCIAQVAPNASGGWNYPYFDNFRVGITYVADGCEPITHGPYDFAYVQPNTIKGFLFIVVAGIEPNHNPYLDVTNTSDPDWVANFDETKDIGLFDYRHSPTAPVIIPKVSKVIDLFDMNWVLEIEGQNAISYKDTHTWEFEILNSSNVVIFALRSTKDGNNSSGLWYGSNLSSLVQTPKSTSQGLTGGVLTFDVNGVNYENTRSNNYNKSFSFTVNLSDASSIRVSGSTTSGSIYTSGGYIKSIERPI